MLRVDGGRIQRDQIVTFKYNGKIFSGYKGDTVASATLAAGVKLYGRSFKYSRPRGIVSSGTDEPNAVLQVGNTESRQTPNILATEQEIYEGLDCKSTNGWPSVNYDVMALFGKVAGAFMPPGFYYKTFMLSTRVWHFFEKIIRSMAGLGRSPTKADEDIYETINHYVDILIVGAGPAGINVALSCADSNKRIMLVDEKPMIGGRLLSGDGECHDSINEQWLNTANEVLLQNKNVQMLTRTTVFGLHDDNFATANERVTEHLPVKEKEGKCRQRVHRIRATKIILATGALERPLVFANNDVPGVMLAGAVNTYIKHFAVLPGQRLLVFANNDSAYQTAVIWREVGGDVAAIVDCRLESTKEDTQNCWVVRAKELGIRTIYSSVASEVYGKKKVTGARIVAIKRDGELGGVEVVGEGEKITCDIVAMSGGWSPVVHLACHCGRKPKWNEDIQGFIAEKLGENIICVGAVAGVYDLSAIQFQSTQLGEHLKGKEGIESLTNSTGDLSNRHERALMPLAIVPHIKSMDKAPKQFVDMQLDVTTVAIKIAINEGFESIEHVKRYTALGFGTDQGKTSNINGLAIAAQLMGLPIEAVGTTVFRPNYTPVTFGAIAGRNCKDLFDIKRYTAISGWHDENGAVYEDVGHWKRPRYFVQGDEGMFAAVNRECQAVRNAVAVLDASTLGKIDIQGDDAREFLNRVYTNAWSKLAIGSCRYGLMCRDDGTVFDDGVTVCLAEKHFMMHTSTGGAASVLEWLELWHQTEWPELKVYFNSVTDHWCTIAISGPKARELLSELTAIDLDPETFKFMQWREGKVAGVSARVHRISFTGELSYEVNVIAHYGLKVWEAVFLAGEKYGITPYGTEAMHVLRAEKGFPIIGQDTDGSITANNLGMGPIVNMNKPYSYLGKRGMMSPEAAKKNAKQLIGLQTKVLDVVLPEGAQLVCDPQQAVPMKMEGHVTSSYYSTILGRSIALALVKGGLDRVGETLYSPQADGSVIEALICNRVFYDEGGIAQRS